MITIRLFGPIEASVNGTAVRRLSLKQRQILAILALSPGRPVPRARLADQLWEGSPPASYVVTLDSYLCGLRRALGLSAGRASALATTAAGFVLDPAVEVDLHWFHRLARAADTNRSRAALEWAEEALELVSGELLAEVPYAGWADRAREQFTRTLVELSTQAAQRANGLGEFKRAAALGRVAVGHDPVCESAWRQLMLAQWFSGNRPQALASYAEFRAAMAEHLGDEPSEDSQQLYLTILRHVPESAAPEAAADWAPRLRTLLTLLRQELELTPGVQAPALDAQLSEVAAHALSELTP